MKKTKKIYSFHFPKHESELKRLGYEHVQMRDKIRGALPRENNDAPIVLVQEWNIAEAAIQFALGHTVAWFESHAGDVELRTARVDWANSQMFADVDGESFDGIIVY